MKNQNFNFMGMYEDFFKNFQDSNPLSNMMSYGNLDMGNVVSCQKRNAETLNNLNKLCSEGVQAMFRSNFEHLQSNSSEVMKSMKDTTQNLQNPEQHAAHTMQSTKHMCDKWMSECRNNLQMMTKLNMEVYDELCKNVSENLSDACKVSKSRKTA